ncbi:MAG TPA: DUF5777 family beta-barrel protein [Paludibacter sp.]|nr:DUF5777 family beta-barrel protein [Paludibacter sp.]
MTHRKRFSRKLVAIFVAGIMAVGAQPQEKGLLQTLDSISPPGIQYAYGTFKSTRVLNGHSIERMQEKQFDFRVEHRFGLVNQGFYEFYGLDQSNSLISLEYGIKNWVMVGINRTSLDKTVSGFTKFSILRQSTGTWIMPVSVSVLLETSVVGTKWLYPDRDNMFLSRVTYASQLLVARKFNEAFSLQLAPVWIHRNLVPTASDTNDMLALGIGSRYKTTRRTSVNFEYYPVLTSWWDHQTSYRNSLSLGFDVETGGHVFTILLTNTTGMIEKSFITETTGKWLKGDLHLGFNISRVFSFK